LYEGPKYLDKLKPEPGPARPEKPGQTYNSAPCQKFHLRILLAWRHKNIFEIKSKYTTLNLQKNTKFHLQHEKIVQQN